jgi:hypothetical protein
MRNLVLIKLAFMRILSTRMRKEASTSVETQFRKNEIRRFLLSEMAKETDCVDIKNGHWPTTCRCLGEINLSEPMHRRGDERKRAVFLLPGTNYLICRDALCKLLGIRREAWTTIFKMAKNNTPPSHGLEGHPGNSKDDGMGALLKTYFQDLLLLATPRATLVIRSLVWDQVETELQDDDEDIVELPSHMTKRSLYDRLLLQIGWKYVYDAKSCIVERQPVEGMEQERALAWSSFQRYWAMGKASPKTLHCRSTGGCVQSMLHLHKSSQICSKNEASSRGRR